MAVGCGGHGGPAAAPRPAPVAATAPDDGVTPDKLAQLDDVIAAGAAWGDAFGFSGYVLVAQHDRVLYQHGFGFADRARRTGFGPDTSFRVGSISKQFTAAAILWLEQHGQLAVGDPVSKYLPEYPGPGKDVTLHQLLTHTAGIPNDDLALLLRKNQRWTTADRLATFWDKPLDFEPGTDFAYSNSGYVVLAAIIERVSGETYADFVREHLFAPAGMTRTASDDAAGDRDRALGYTSSGGAIAPADDIDLSTELGAGSIRSTANDLVRWHRALAGDTILAAAERDKLYRAERDGYAYGWVNADVAGHHVVWHNGAVDGFHADLWRVPDADLVVVVLGNLYELDTGAIARDAVTAAFGGTVAAAGAPIALDPAIAARVAGHYAVTPDGKRAMIDLGLPAAVIDSVATMDVAGGDDDLVLTPAGQPGVHLRAIAAGVFFDPARQVKVTFELGASGPATGFTLAQGPLSAAYTRDLQ